MMAYLKYINPDELYNGSEHNNWSSDHTAFVYTPDHKLFIEKDSNHPAMAAHFPELRKYGERKTDFQKTCLVGRIANDYVHQFGTGTKFRHFKDKENIISFWNVDADLYKSLLEPCLKALLNKNLIYNDTTISTVRGRWKVSQLINDPSSMFQTKVGDNNSEFIPLSDVEKNRVAKLQQLHTLGIEKNQALKDRGIKPKIGTRRPVIGDHYHLNFKGYLNE